MNTYFMDRRIKSVLLGVSQPARCAATPINGIEYYKCDYGVYYRAAFRGNNLAYVVSQP